MRTTTKQYGFALVAAIASAVVAGQASAQHTWEGSISQDWGTAGNWTVLQRGAPAPAPTPPDLSTLVNIGSTSPFPIVSAGFQQAQFVNVGTTDGPGRLDVTGGSLQIGETSGDDLEIGADDTGTVNVSGGTIVIGDDLNVDRNAVGNYASTLTVTGGEIFVGDRTEFGSGSTSDYLIDIQGGYLGTEDDLRVRGGAGSELRVSGGLVEGDDTFDVDTLATIQDVGIIRVEQLTDVGDFSGTVVINDMGLLQIEIGAGTELSEIEGYIADGTFTTNGLGLAIQSIVVPEFFGNTDVGFYQVSVVPEPASSAIALGVLSIGMGVRGRSRR